MDRIESHMRPGCLNPKQSNKSEEWTEDQTRNEQNSVRPNQKKLRAIRRGDQVQYKEHSDVRKMP